MLGHLCISPIVEKVRNWVTHNGMVWEVDVYAGEAAGLVLAELELERTDQRFVLPNWVGLEVSDNPRYRGEGIAHGLWREAKPVSAKPRPPLAGHRLAPRPGPRQNGEAEAIAGQLARR